MYVKVKTLSENTKLPSYATPGSSGMDICSTIACKLYPGEVKAIPTGIAVQIPENHELQIRPRSGLALKKHITVLNTPGTVDEDYRDEIKVILINFGNEPFEISVGDRIAQMVLCPVVKAQWFVTNDLNETQRDGGFGSTGIK